MDYRESADGRKRMDWPGGDIDREVHRRGEVLRAAGLSREMEDRFWMDDPGAERLLEHNRAAYVSAVQRILGTERSDFSDEELRGFYPLVRDELKKIIIP